jgi:hypothetical protein
MLFDIFGNSIEKFTENKENTEFLALVGNLATSGTIKAKDFIKEDGSSVKEVHKLALPKNFKVEDNKTKVLGDFTTTGEFLVKSGDKNVFKVNKDGDVAINGRLYSSGTDLHLFNKERAGNNDHPGRALVHGGNDTLMVNFNGDYKGGTMINSNLVITGNTTFGHRWNNGVDKNPVNVGKPDAGGNFSNGSAYLSFLDTDVDGVNKGTSIAFVPHQWGVPNSERMRISANGNVGIGNNNPQAKLDVNGNIKTNQLCIGDRWCINAEGDHLVFRDNKSGGDKRYAMFANNFKDL